MLLWTTSGDPRGMVPPLPQPSQLPPSCRLWRQPPCRLPGLALEATGCVLCRAPGTFRPWPQSFSPWDLGLCSLDLCLTAVWAPFPSQGAVSRAIPDQELRETVLTRDHGAPSPQLLGVPGPGGHAPIPRGPSPKQWTQGTEAGPGGGDLDSCTACWWWRRPLLWAGRLTATQGCSGGSAGGAHVEGSQSEAVSLAP